MPERGRSEGWQQMLPSRLGVREVGCGEGLDSNTYFEVFWGYWGDKALLHFCVLLRQGFSVLGLKVCPIVLCPIVCFKCHQNETRHIWLCL